MLAGRLTRLGYKASHQTGSHIIVRTAEFGEHTEVIPAHKPLKIGTLGSILKRVAAHHGITIFELLAILELDN